MSLRLPYALAPRIALILLIVCSAWSHASHAEAERPRASAGRKTREKARREKPPADSAASRRAARLGLGTRPAAGQLLAGRAEPAWIRAASNDARLPGTLHMPVAKGWFVRGFGSGKGGYHQAMDIGGEIGWNVRAAAPGIVGYAGDEVNGYGNLVILIHQAGWITVYGHNAKNRVVAGQRVERGSVIASLGSTGRSKGPHVHFELLYAGENCDPGPLLRPSVRHRNGSPLVFKRVVWRTPKKRPSVIACHARKHHPDYVNKAEDEDEGSDDENAPP